MRHSRSQQVNEALESVDAVSSVQRWTDLADDPNDPTAVLQRAETLRAAWRPSISDRIEFLEARCTGRKVLDIGCVAHDVARMSSPNWLHARLAAAAARCVGVDVLTDGVEEMRRLGFEAVAHDLGAGLGPLAELAPFDVIVAGELIEHVESIDMLFAVAAAALAPAGQLIITTPNPYAPHRVRAAQLGIVWENVDHILYAFPSGVAELAERHGLVLTEATVTEDKRPTGATRQMKNALRRLRGAQWMTVGFSSVGGRGARRVSWGRAARGWHGMWWPRRRFLGETFIYVVSRTTKSEGSA